MTLPSLRARFDRISRAAIDASSIIYMLKGGYFGLLASTLDLQSVPEVLAEVGWPELPVTPVDLSGGNDASTTTRDPAEAAAPDSETAAGPANSPEDSTPPGAATSPGAAAPGASAPLTNDELLLQLAGERGIPVISEDRAILGAAEAAGIEYYNALMMLALLLYRGRMDEQWFREAYKRVVEVSRYGEKILDRYETHLAELGLPSARGD